METSLKTGFAQIYSCCPKNLSCPKFGGAAAPLAPPARTPMSGLCSSRAWRLLTVFLGWLENLSFLHRNGHPWFQRFWVFLGLPTGFLRTQPWRCFLPAFARNLCPLMFLAFCDIPKSFTSTYGDWVFHLRPPNFGTTCW